MGKNNRTEVVRVLREHMEAETDPQKKVEYAKQLAKLLPRPRQARRPRKPEATRQPNNRCSLREIYTGPAYDSMSDVDLVLHHLVLQIEKRQRAGELKTKAERDAFVPEVLWSLPENERAAYEALNSDVA